MSAPGPHVVYRSLGAYDAAFEATVRAGVVRTEGGSYVTRGVRERALVPRERDALARLAAAVEAPAAFAAPEAAEGFGAEVLVDGRRVTWWGPPPTPALAALVRFLNTR